MQDYVTISVKAIKRDSYGEEMIHRYCYSYPSKFIPRIGEKICIEYWEAEIYDIHWNDEDVILFVDCSHFA